MLAISTQACLVPYSSIRLLSLLVITSFNLMLASIWAIIGSEANTNRQTVMNLFLFICLVFVTYWYVVLIIHRRTVPQFVR